jgi:hypothetical protein
VGRLQNCSYVKIIALTNLAPFEDNIGDELPDSMAEWRNAIENYEIEVSSNITNINNTSKT